MTFQVELSKCRWTTQGIDPTHIFPNPSMELNEGPILVSLMNDQNYFVHDGRHRCIRGLLRQDELIDADWLEDHDADVEVARLREALKGHVGVRSIEELVADGDLSVNDARKAAGFPSYNGPIAYPWLTNGQVGDIYDAVVLRNGAVVVNPDSPVRDALLHALDDAIYKAVCGRENLHEPHAFGEHMEEFCSGQPRPRRALCGKTYKHKPHDASLDDLLAPDEVCDGIPK